MGGERRKHDGERWTSIPRRTFLKTAAASAGAAALGGIPGILAAGEAPAYPKGTKLHLLTRQNFFPAADKIFLAQAEEFGKQMGVEIMVERIGQNDIVTRTTAAIVSGSGADIIILHNNFPHLVADGLADVSDVAEEIGRQQGGYYDLFRADAYVGNRWLGVPHVALSTAMNYREDWLKEAGVTKLPDTWEELREVGKKLKSMGHPVGQAFGHSENDPNTYSYSLMWSYGGYEVEKDGKTVVLDKKGTLEAIKLNTAMWKDALDEGGLSWDDSSNNRAFLAEAVSVTGNAASIYWAEKKNAPKLRDVTEHALWPKGPAGRFGYSTSISLGIFRFSKAQKEAKAFIKWLMEPKQYSAWMGIGEGMMAGLLNYYEDDPVWKKDPKLEVVREIPKYVRMPGYPGPPTRYAAESMVKYVVVNMFARGVKGMATAETIKIAESELKEIYGKA